MVERPAEDPLSTHLELNDQELIARVCQRDRAAFSLLYDRYHGTIYILAAHMLDPAEAEEVVQEVFLRLWRKAHQFQAERGAFRTWLMAIARHHVLDRLRGLDQQRRLARAEEIDQRMAVAAELVSVEEEAWQRDVGEALLQALNGLPAEQRRALVLAYFSGLSQADIAKHLGWPLGTVKKRLRLGLQKLRSSLAQKGVGVENDFSVATPPNRGEGK